MNCWDCKNFSCTTYHQPGFGSKESKHCRKRQMTINNVIDKKDCKDFEEGKSTNYIKYL